MEPSWHSFVLCHKQGVRSENYTHSGFQILEFDKCFCRIGSSNVSVAMVTSLEIFCNE